MSIKARSIIEIMGAPREHVDQAMGIVLSKLKESESIKLLHEKVFEAKPLEGKPFFSTFCEVDIEVKDISDLFGFCFDFMPSSVEVFEPVQMELKAGDINSMCNEMVAKMHQYDMAMRNIYAENIVLKRKLDGVMGKGEKKVPEKK